MFSTVVIIIYQIDRYQINIEGRGKNDEQTVISNYEYVHIYILRYAEKKQLICAMSID